MKDCRLVATAAPNRQEKQDATQLDLSPVLDTDPELSASAVGAVEADTRHSVCPCSLRASGCFRIDALSVMM